MRDLLPLADVILTDASPEEIRRGLLGFVRIELAGGLVIEGTTLRRSRQGKPYVAFPRNRRGYPYIWLRTAIARRDLERQVFERLGIAASHVGRDGTSGGAP